MSGLRPTRALLAGAVSLVIVTGVALAGGVGAIKGRQSAVQQTIATSPDNAGAVRLFLSPQEAQRGADTGLLPPDVHSVLNIRNRMNYGEYRWDDTGVPPGRLAIRVDVDRQMISVFRAGHEIGTAVALYGMDGKGTPLGRFPIKDKREDYHSRTYDAPMPYSLWLTDDGVAVHGSSVRGGRATNGCVGVPVDFARRLFAAAKVGDVVEVVSSRSETGLKSG